MCVCIFDMKKKKKSMSWWLWTWLKSMAPICIIKHAVQLSIADARLGITQLLSAV